MQRTKTRRDPLQDKNSTAEKAPRLLHFRKFPQKAVDTNGAEADTCNMPQSSGPNETERTMRAFDYETQRWVNDPREAVSLALRQQRDHLEALTSERGAHYWDFIKSKRDHRSLEQAIADCRATIARLESKVECAHRSKLTPDGNGAYCLDCSETLA